MPKDVDVINIMRCIVMCNSECGCSVGCVLLFFNAVNAFTKCYPVNSQNYCFYTNGSVMSWDEAREFCESRNSTLPIITDADIDNVLQRFTSDSNIVRVNASDTQHINNYVWIGAHARHVDRTVQWHWINGQPSG